MENASVYTAKTAVDLCKEHLPHVSRTFALTIPVLEEPLRSYVGLAYLLCRVADTAEDHPHLDQSSRDEWLVFLENHVSLQKSTRVTPRPKWIPYPDAHYQALFEAAPQIFSARKELPYRVQRMIDACLLEMIQGMRGFPGRDPKRSWILACEDLTELDSYCHVVAGTVGILLTRLFAQRLGQTWASDNQIERGRRFGLGLQMVNILKDRLGDEARGVSYCPDVGPKTNLGIPVPVVERALDHLSAGHEFIAAIPNDARDLQEFSLIPHTLALRTLAHLLEGRQKVPREELRGLLLKTQVTLGNQSAIESLFLENRTLVANHLKAIRTRIS